MRPSSIKSTRSHEPSPSGSPRAESRLMAPSEASARACTLLARLPPAVAAASHRVGKTCKGVGKSWCLHDRVLPVVSARLGSARRTDAPTRPSLNVRTFPSLSTRSLDLCAHFLALATSPGAWSILCALFRSASAVGFYEKVRTFFGLMRGGGDLLRKHCAWRPATIRSCTSRFYLVADPCPAQRAE